MRKILIMIISIILIVLLLLKFKEIIHNNMEEKRCDNMSISEALNNETCKKYIKKWGENK